MKYKFFYPLLIFLVLLGSLSATAGTNKASSLEVDKPYIQIDIQEAYYADLEGDGMEDDVFVGVELSFFGSSVYNFDYYIFLTLPSGAEFGYAVALAAHTDVAYLGNFFWNHATESGDYKVTVHTVLRTGGITLFTDCVIFDPPGGTGGSDPIRFDLVF